MCHLELIIGYFSNTGPHSPLFLYMQSKNVGRIYYFLYENRKGLKDRFNQFREMFNILQKGCVISSFFGGATATTEMVLDHNLMCVQRSQVWCTNYTDTKGERPETKAGEASRANLRYFSSHVVGNGTFVSMSHEKIKYFLEEVGGFHFDEKIRPLCAPLYFLYVPCLVCQTAKGSGGRGKNLYSSFFFPAALPINTVRFRYWNSTIVCFVGSLLDCCVCG